MRIALLALPLLLVACATPREQCISSVTRDLRIVNGLVQQTQGNINRGFAVDERQEVRTRRDRCTIRNEDGSSSRFWCDRTDVVDIAVPVAIDLRVERAKLDSLLQQQAQMKRASDAAVGRCIAIHPE